MLDEINAEIDRLTRQPLTYQSIHTLADLYTVRDHIQTTCTGETEFLKLCSGKPVTEVLAVMDELMEIVKAMNERLYEGVQRKLTAI